MRELERTYILLCAGLPSYIEGCYVSTCFLLSACNFLKFFIFYHFSKIYLLFCRAWPQGFIFRTYLIKIPLEISRLKRKVMMTIDKSY